MTNLTESASPEGRVLPRFLDKLMGVRVLLINSVFEAEQDGETVPVVPDIQGLEAAVAVARITVPDKLSGREIRFLRKAICKKSTELARFLDVTPSTFSRWENDRDVMSTNTERVFRLRILNSLRRCAPGVEVKVETILEMKISPFRAPAHPTTLIFEHLHGLVDGESADVWVYQGTSNEEDELVSHIRRRA
jgi:transcriptional regulator with XRE-family HTH domain